MFRATDILGLCWCSAIRLAYCDGSTRKNESLYVHTTFLHSTWFAVTDDTWMNVSDPVYSLSDLRQTPEGLSWPITVHDKNLKLPFSGMFDQTTQEENDSVCLPPGHDNTEDHDVTSVQDPPATVELSSRGDKCSNTTHRQDTVLFLYECDKLP